MGKKKGTDGKRVANPHLVARTAYLYQAAKYLTLCHGPDGTVEPQHALSQSGDLSERLRHPHLDQRRACGVSDVVRDTPANVHQSKPEENQALQTNNHQAGIVSNRARSESSNPSQSIQPRQQFYPLSQGLPRHLTTHLRAISLKSKVRLTRDIKRSLCKHCNAVLVPDCSARVWAENTSKGASKPWADANMVECLVCGASRRFPVRNERQRKARDRVVAREKGTKNDEMIESQDVG
jgi:ribonuclease P protein subunit RPR2